MNRSMPHTDIQELLGAYALDAVDGAEAAVVEAHLATCPRCAEEVREHREVASLLAYAGTAAPEGMWDRLAAVLDDAPPASAAPTLGRAGWTAGVGTGSRRRRALAIASVATVASLFAGLGAVGGMQVQSALRNQGSETEKVRTEEAARARLLSEAAAAALADGARSVRLVTPDKAHMADAVVLPDGTGYLIDRGAPVLAPGRTYQLWAVAAGQKLSVGVLGPDVDVVSFWAPQSTDALALTVEQSPGVVASSNQAVGYGLVKQ